jgi:hypothetical protein
MHNLLERGWKQHALVSSIHDIFIFRAPDNFQVQRVIAPKLGLKYFWSCGAAGSSFDVLLDGVG